MFKMISLIFKLFCVTFFCVEAMRAVHRYLSQHSVTRDTVQRQELFPKPKVCISSYPKLDFAGEFVFLQLFAVICLLINTF